MDVNELARIPPIVQIVGVGLLAVYVVVSIVGRLSPRFRWLWRDPRKRHRFGHIFEYTLIPAALLAASVAAVAYNWDYRLPLYGSWTKRDLVLGPGAALLGLLLIVAGASLGRDADLKNPAVFRSWVPFILIVAGIALMSVGILRFR